MKIIVIEDEEFKRDEITSFLTKHNIEFEIFEYVYPALRYILGNKDGISGIILDLGLQSSPSMFDRSLYRGFDVVKELNRKKLDIPILINSSTEVDMIDSYPSVFGQKHEMYDDETLDSFIRYLRKREEQ